MTKKKSLLVVCFNLILCILICVICKPNYYRLYLGDRIKGNIELIIDEKPYLIEENKIKFLDFGNGMIYDDGKADISIRAGEYGKYRFEILDTPIGKPISISCFQHNWWNVLDFDLTIKIDTVQEEITYNGNCITIADNGKKIYDPISNTQSLTDEYIQISLGL